eukprot:15528-Heterococcus_DN1.PRE.3
MSVALARARPITVVVRHMSLVYSTYSVQMENVSPQAQHQQSVLVQKQATTSGSYAPLCTRFCSLAYASASTAC